MRMLLCKCCWKEVREKQEDEAVLDVTPLDESSDTYCSNLDGLQYDVQDVACEQMTYDEVDVQHDVDVFADDPPDVHLDVVNDILAEFSKMSLRMFYLNSSMLSALL